MENSSCSITQNQHFDDGDTSNGPKRKRARRRCHRHTPRRDAKRTKKETKDNRTGAQTRESRSTKSPKLLGPGNTSRSSHPLQGKVVALSSALVHENTSEERTKYGSKTTHDARLSYKELEALCHSAGAKVTSMVHKRVFCVIVTNVAATQHTQRIRKARKHGIPVVHVSWLEECILQQTIVPFHHVNFEPNAIQNVSTASSAITTTEKQELPPNQSEIDERIVDLGCCCVCHEQGSSDTCTWCVDCNFKR